MTGHEKFKSITEGIHHIVIILAIIVGAIWTLWTFWSLGERQKAQDELFKQAVIDISIECKQQQIEHNNDDYIQANVKIVNQGKRNTFLDFKDPPLNVEKLIFNDDGSSKIAYTLEQKSYTSASIVLRSGATQGYSFVVKVPEKGFYLVRFLVPLDSTEVKEHVVAGGPKGKINWTGTTSILIN